LRVIDHVDTHRETVTSLIELYQSSVNNKMNEVMKVMAVVTCLLAPATVIGGIFGMNFASIPWLNSPYGLVL